MKLFVWETVAISVQLPIQHFTLAYMNPYRPHLLAKRSTCTVQTTILLPNSFFDALQNTFICMVSVSVFWILPGLQRFFVRDVDKGLTSTYTCTSLLIYIEIITTVCDPRRCISSSCLRSDCRIKRARRASLMRQSDLRQRELIQRSGTHSVVIIYLSYTSFLMSKSHKTGVHRLGQAVNIAVLLTPNSYSLQNIVRIYMINASLSAITF